jgi:hypothetical protein
VSCGRGGFAHRDVLCIDMSGAPMDEAKCGESKPERQVRLIVARWRVIVGAIPHRRTKGTCEYQ